MEARLRDALNRIGEADRALRDHGRDPESFHLVYAGGASREILHGGWDSSWSVPTAEDIDDLEELGYLRTEPATNSKRVFALGVRGREEARVLAARSPGARGASAAPSAESVLKWLGELEQAAPEIMSSPSSLLDRAQGDGLIDAQGREAFAEKVIDLADDGYLRGFIPDFQQADCEQRLALAEGLRLALKATNQIQPPRPTQSMNFYGDVVAGQIAAGDISNFASFAEVLDQADQQLQALEGVEEEDREDARTLLKTLRGEVTEASAAVATGAGGGLLAQVLAQLLGL